MHRVLAMLLGIAAGAMLVLGFYTLAVADRPEYEGAENYGGMVLILGLAVAAMAWMIYPRGE